VASRTGVSASFAACCCLCCGSDSADCCCHFLSAGSCSSVGCCCLVCCGCWGMSAGGGWRSCDMLSRSRRAFTQSGEKRVEGRWNALLMKQTVHERH
jgi:hypothetical protein